MRALPDRLLVVTERELSSADLPSVVHDAVSAGARWVWFRDKNLGRPERLALARRVCEAIGGRAVMSVGADIQLAMDLGARAVHLPMSTDVPVVRQQLGPDALIGLSAHSLADVAVAKSLGADYVTLSPVFKTSSKPGYGPSLGLSALKAGAASGIPVLALGGVTPANVASCIEAGASGVAVMGGIMAAEEIGATVGQYLAAIGPRGSDDQIRQRSPGRCS